MKKKRLPVNSQNIKQEIDIQVTFIFENKALKVHFLANYEDFCAANVSFLKPCQDGIYTMISQNIYQEIGIQVTFILEIKLEKYIF